MSAESRVLRAKVIDSGDPVIDEARRTTEKWFSTHAAAGRIRTMPLDMYDVLMMGPLYEYAAHRLQGVELTPVDDAAELIGAAAWRSLSP